MESKSENKSPEGSSKESKRGSLTTRQLELLEFIEQTCHEEHRMPTYREMAKALGVSAVGTIQDHLSVLVEKGILVREGRNLKLCETRSGPMMSVPIVGEVAAGSLQDVYEVAMGTLAVSPHLMDRKGGPGDFFALRVKGESMVEVGIYHGDFVVVRKNARVKSGDIVVAAHNNEATVKEIKMPAKPGGEVLLIPHNKTMKPIHIEPTDEFNVWGKVVAVQRYLD